MLTPDRSVTAALASIAFVIAPFAIEVAFPTLVTTPVKFAFVVTVEAFPLTLIGHVPVAPVPSVCGAPISAGVSADNASVISSRLEKISHATPLFFVN